ncbi:MAG: DEAD/DEAH box helicase [Bacteroidaceae bacterium]|nr:DEAD/DEAH box helicase [Bacteroidaceae bacterium]
MTFQDLGLCAPLLQAIAELGFETPMPVQEAVIPHQLQTTQDLVALAQTGTGKTAAYGLPLLQRLSGLTPDSPSQPLSTSEASLPAPSEASLPAPSEASLPAPSFQPGPQVRSAATSSQPVPLAVILSPTRELCLQIADDLESFSRYLPDVRILRVYGGMDIMPQLRALRQGVHIIVATPGRLIDLMNRGAAVLESVHTVILDEADEMLSMGFSESIDAILEGVPEQHRTLLFSATMSREIERIAQNYLHDAREVVVGSRNEGAENVNHIYYMVRASDKYLALKRVVDYFPKIYAIVFCRTRLETQEIADHLIRDGYNADALHGDLSQQQRDLTMQRFRQHRIQLLVATDVAARGLDVDDLTHVINYGMPDDSEVYAHRSGRTGRAGKRGTSICIVHSRERGRIREVERLIQKEFQRGTLPSPKEICSKQLWKVIDDIERVEVDDEEIEEFLPEVRRKLEWLDKEDLLKRLVSREFGRFLAYYANAPEIEEVTTEKKEKGAKEKNAKEKGRERRRAGDHEAEAGYSRLFITLGKADGFYARELIGFINRHVQGEKVEIGRIDLRPRFSFFEVPESEARRVLQAMQGLQHKGRRVGVDLAEPSPSDAAPSSRGSASSSPHGGKPTAKSRAQRRFEKAQQSEPKKNSRKARGQEKTGSRKDKGHRKDDWRQFFGKK